MSIVEEAGMRKVYLDNASTTPLLPEVKEAMLPYLGEMFGNPSSLHDWGDAARMAVDEAREKVAALINADPEEIIFTGSGTESNNLAVKGMALAQQTKGKHVVVSAIEHFSVLHSARTLEKWGFEVTEVPVDKYGVGRPRSGAPQHQKRHGAGLRHARQRRDRHHRADKGNCQDNTGDENPLPYRCRGDGRDDPG